MRSKILFILPGLGGLALNQAMFWGKPCIVSEADGTEDDLVIEHLTGFRFKSDDKFSLLNAMERALTLYNLAYSILSFNSQKKIRAVNNVDYMVKTFNNTIKTK